MEMEIKWNNRPHIPPRNKQNKQTKQKKKKQETSQYKVAYKTSKHLFLRKY